MLSAAFKIEILDDINIKLPLIEPSISFVGKVSSRSELIDDDCRLAVDLLEYNNFNFANKEKMTFKIQVVFDAGSASRFKKLPTILDIGKLIFVTGFIDLDDNQIFVEAKEIDILDDSINSIGNHTNSRPPFSRTNKFKNNNNIKKEIMNNVIKIIKDDDEIINDNNNEINEKLQDDDINVSNKKRSYIDQRESQITKKKVKSSDANDEIEIKRNTNVTTRSQKFKDK